MLQVDEWVLFWAFRYSLGRMTAAVSSTAKAIIANADKLTPHTKERITEEIGEAIKNNDAGHECDVEDWQKVVARFTTPYEIKLKRGVRGIITQPCYRCNGHYYYADMQRFVPDEAIESATLVTT